MFHFANYASPNWYYNFCSQQKRGYYILDFRKLTKEERKIIDYDSNYQSEEASLLDAAYQALVKGVIINDETKALDTSSFKISIFDNYRFLKKYYHPCWVFFVLTFRILSFKDWHVPFVFLNRLCKVKRLDHLAKHNNLTLKDFNSELIGKNPKVTVIIPTLNRYKYLVQCIKDIESQSYKNLELIIVDQTEDFQEEIYNGWNLELIVIRQEEKMLWKARNEAIKRAKGEYILLYDDDSIVESNWVEMHLKCLDFFNVQISSGVSIAKVGRKVPKNYSFYRWADQIDTGNVMMKKSVFKNIGLFDRQFERMRLGDGEFGFRAFFNDYPIISNSEAPRIHLKVGTGGLRQMGSWDAFRSTKWLAPKPVPSVIYLYKRYLPKLNYRFVIFTGLVLSNMEYKDKRKTINYYLSIFKSLFLWPFLIYSFLKSNSIANKMIKAGSKIDSL